MTEKQFFVHFLQINYYYFCPDCFVPEPETIKIIVMIIYCKKWLYTVTVLLQSLMVLLQSRKNFLVSGDSLDEKKWQKSLSRIRIATLILAHLHVEHDLLAPPGALTRHSAQGLPVLPPLKLFVKSLWMKQRNKMSQNSRKSPQKILKVFTKHLDSLCQKSRQFFPKI